jgi:phosphoglycolate phosphatase
MGLRRASPAEQGVQRPVDAAGRVSPVPVAAMNERAAFMKKAGEWTSGPRILHCRTMPRFRLVVFDLDGTLVDSRRDLADATNELIIGHGAAALDQRAIVGMVGEGVSMLIGRAFAAAGIGTVPPDAVRRFLEIYDRRLLAHTRPYPGIPETLARASTLVRLAVLTNKPGAPSRKILEGLGLAALFSAILGGDNPFGRKPGPAALRHLAADAGGPPSDTLMVGDSLIDLDTARNAGTQVCLARYGFGFGSIAPDRLRGDEEFIDEPADLLRLLGSAPSS